jgi:hypothetical protein
VLPHLDYKWIIVGVLFGLLILVKLLAGGRPFDKPVRRTRRLGPRAERLYLGSLEPVDSPPKRTTHSPTTLGENPLPDPEKEFFRDS